ncbi:hypothetical protein QTP70_021875 [Hemibagrus guttatus]|uniref:Uncharacterized protein n=1 Tax=Hemibagrus guttatus TaxID=175788 RepID=A0AAE0UW71_9TELE|nr:hypothetical protein QTP70_021875 [Hemibagrus guttatus]
MHDCGISNNNCNHIQHSLSAAYPNYTRVTGSLCLSQASLGLKAGYTLDGVPTHRRAHAHSHSLTTDNLEMPINLQCMSLDRGGHQSTGRKPPRHGENMQTPHTHGGGRNRTPNPGVQL